MKKSKIRTSSSLIAQIHPGVETEVIVSDNVMYIPVMTLPTFGNATSAAPVEEAEDEQEEVAPKETANKPKPTGKKYTEAQLKKMDATNDLMPILEGLGVDPADYPGKNSNKKLRDLILETQEEIDEAADDAEEAPKKEETNDSNDSILDEVSDILDDLDEEKVEDDAAIKSLVKLGVEKKAAKKFIDKFMDDEDLEIDDLAKEIADSVDGEEEEEEAPKPKRGKKASKTLKTADVKVKDKLVVINIAEEETYNVEVDRIEDDEVTIFFPDTDEEDVLTDEDYTIVSKG